MRQYKLKKCKRVHGLHFAPDGARLLAVGGAEAGMVDCAVWLDLATGETVGRIEQYANCYAVDPGLTRYVLGGADNWTGIRDGIAAVQWAALDGGDEWYTFPTPRKKARQPFREVTGLAFDPTGTRLAIGHAAGNTWSQVSVVPRDALEPRVVLRYDAAPGVIAFNADATRVAVTGGPEGDTVAIVSDVARGNDLFAFEPPGTKTRCVRFLPDNRLLVANGRYVYVLPAEGGEPPFTLAGHPKQVNAVAITPDGRRVLTASHDGAIRTWGASTGEPGPAFDWGIGAVTAVGFAPDGLTCAAAGLNGQVVVWDVDG